MGIKIGAHPLVVAVAMGLLGPGAVLGERDDEADDTLASSEPHLSPDDAPTAEEFARVEDLWHSVRTQI